MIAVAMYVIGVKDTLIMIPTGTRDNCFLRQKTFSDGSYTNSNVGIGELF